jgi:hypothetical protein
MPDTATERLFEEDSIRAITEQRDRLQAEVERLKQRLELAEKTIGYMRADRAFRDAEIEQLRRRLAQKIPLEPQREALMRSPDLGWLWGQPPHRNNAPVDRSPFGAGVVIEFDHGDAGQAATHLANWATCSSHGKINLAAGKMAPPVKSNKP